MAAPWAASPADVALVLVDRTEATLGQFDDHTHPTLAQVQALLDLHEVAVLADVWDVDMGIPEALYPIARLAHAHLIAALVENTFGEQVEQTQRAEFFNRRAQQYVAMLRQRVGDHRRERNAQDRVQRPTG